MKGRIFRMNTVYHSALSAAILFSKEIGEAMRKFDKNNNIYMPLLYPSCTLILN